MELFGRWAELVERHQKERIGNPNSTAKLNEQREAATASQPSDSIVEDDQCLSTESRQKQRTETEKPQENLTQPPTEAEYELPTNEEEFESMVDRFASIGLKRVDLEKVLESRRTAFNRALREFKNMEKKKKADDAKANKKPRNNSLVKK